MSSYNNSSNKKDSKKIELTSSAKKVFRLSIENHEDSNNNLMVKSGNAKKAQIEGDRFIPSRSNLNNTNTQYFILQHKYSNKDLKSSQSNYNTNSINHEPTLSQNSGESTQELINNNTNFQNYLVDMNLCNNSSRFDNQSNDTLANFSQTDSILSKERVLNFNSKTKAMPNFISNLKGLMEKSKSFIVNKKHVRQISSIPERVLDAPSLIDDYYLNLLDWSSTNILSVCLGNSVYLWNGNTQETKLLMQNNDYISSVSWMECGTCIAIGLPNGSVQLWDTNKMTQIRKMSSHSQRVGSLAWNKYILSSGSRDSKIYNHDVRIKEHITQCLIGHTQEVCGLKWSYDGSLLASGGNDNLLCIWDVNISNNPYIISNPFQINSIVNNSTNISPVLHHDLFNFNDNGNSNLTNVHSTENSNNPNSQMTGNMLLNLLNLNDNQSNTNRNHNNNNPPINNIKYFSPKFKLSSHKSAVKALSWCPWQKGLLATGGGKQDKSIKIWNAELGTMIKSIDTNSQVCSLVWNKYEKEIISSHGYSKNQLTLWKYPQMTKITELTGHLERVLYMALSPDGTTIVSGASDETLRFWKVFQPSIEEKNINDANRNPLPNFSSNFQIR